MAFKKLKINLVQLEVTKVRFRQLFHQIFTFTLGILRKELGLLIDRKNANLWHKKGDINNFFDTISLHYLYTYNLDSKVLKKQICRCTKERAIVCKLTFRIISFFNEKYSTTRKKNAHFIQEVGVLWAIKPSDFECKYSKVSIISPGRSRLLHRIWKKIVLVV